MLDKKETNYPALSVIIPVKPGRKFDSALEALRRADYPADLIEVFLAHGFFPSKQRNMAAEKATGDILYFLDDDSEIDTHAFKKAAAAFSGEKTSTRASGSRGISFFPGWLSDLINMKFFSGKITENEIGVVGGPNVWLRDESFWASASGTIFESFFAHSKMAARYRPIGSIHRATEKELILCNLAVKREVFRKVGAFNESLFPNEENELLNRIEKAGYQLIYHPGVLVHRPRRESCLQILKAFFTYGQGRMEQMRIEGIGQNFFLLAPLFLLLYLLGLSFYHPWFAFLPLYLYFGMGFGSAMGFAIRRKKSYLAVLLPFLFLVSHLSYAVGLLRGLSITLNHKNGLEKDAEIKVEKLKEFGQNWR